jgi:hypothetical protein
LKGHGAVGSSAMHCVAEVSVAQRKAVSRAIACFSSPKKRTDLALCGNLDAFCFPII